MFSEQTRVSKLLLQIRIFLALVSDYKIDYKRIVILSQYKAQVKYIERELQEFGYDRPNVSTVVSSQGTCAETRTSCHKLKTFSS